VIKERVRFSWDRDGNEPLDDISLDEPVRVGESKEVTVWVHNLGKWPLIDLIFNVEGGEIEIVEAPEEIEAFSAEPVRLQITPREPESEEDEKPVSGTLTMEYSYVIK